MSNHKVTLWPSGEVLEVSGEENLLAQLKKAGKKIKSSCGGCASCGDCVVVVKSGESNLTPQTFEELRLLGNVFHITKERLSCQTKITGDITLDVSAHEKNSFTGKGEKSVGSVSKSTQTLLKKKADLENEASQSKEKSGEKPSSSWYRHWENKDEDAPAKKKNLGGNRRPKPFKYSDDSGNNDEN